MGNCTNNCNPCETSCDNINQLANKTANYARQATREAVNAANSALEAAESAVSAAASAEASYNAPAGGDLTGNFPDPQIAPGVIVNADISPTAGIVDTKLATISTAGKVANSATTATSANTANAIVARNASGDFTANAITGNSDATINQVSIGKGGGNVLYNTAVGTLALSGNTTGDFTTAVGNRALNSNTTGTKNVAVGYRSLNNNTTGIDNTAVGYYALDGSDIGSKNTAIGSNALTTAVGSYENCSGLGYQSDISGSNQVQLGNNLTTTYVYGTVQNRSDLRDKADIRDTRLGLEFIEALRPVDYKWDMREDYRPEAPERPNDDATDAEKAAYEAAKAKWREDVKLANIKHDGSKKRSRYHHGLIAQEVKAVLDAKKIDFGGFQDHKIAGGDDVLSIGYDELIAPMIKAIQELSAEVTLLKSQINQ